MEKSRPNLAQDERTEAGRYLPSARAENARPVANTEETKLWTAYEAADFLNMARPTFYLMMRRGEGPKAHRVTRRRYRFYPSDVIAWLKTREMPRKETEEL